MTSVSKQRSAVLVEPLTTQVQSGAVPEPAAGQVRVRLEGCGICASNLPLWEGRPWFEYPRAAGAPGHEGWGWIDAVGAEVNDMVQGDRVAVISAHAYADYEVAPRSALVRLPRALDALPFPGEALGCVMNIFERSDIRAGHHVAIVGAGFLGLLLAQLSVRTGASVVALSRRRYALALARRMGVQETVEISDHVAARERALDMVAGRGYDRVIEAVGVQAALDLASALTAEGSRLIIAGYHQDGLRQVNMQQWNWRGIDVVNAHERSLQRCILGVERAVLAIVDGRLDPFPLLTHPLALEQLDRGFAWTRDRPDGFVKAVMLTGARA